MDLLRVTARDVSPDACDMAYINTTMWGIPAHIIQGDTLKMEVVKAWKNIHWHWVGEDGRQMFKRLDDFIQSPVNDPEQSELESEQGTPKEPESGHS